MSIQLMSKVWAKADASGGELLVLLALADFSNDDCEGLAWPSIRTLAKKSRLGIRQTQYAIRSLQHRGLLVVREGEGPKGTNLYTVIPDGGAVQCRGVKTAGVQPGAHEGAACCTERGAVGCIQTVSTTVKEPLSTNSSLTIYESYPKKVAKPSALKAIARALRSYSFEFLLERTRLYAQIVADWPEKKFIPYPATWFNDERFNDDPETWKPTTNQQPDKASLWQQEELNKTLQWLNKQKEERQKRQQANLLFHVEQPAKSAKGQSPFTLPKATTS